MICPDCGQKTFVVSRKTGKSVCGHCAACGLEGCCLVTGVN